MAHMKISYMYMRPLTTKVKKTFAANIKIHKRNIK